MSAMMPTAITTATVTTMARGMMTKTTKATMTMMNVEMTVLLQQLLLKKNDKKAQSLP